MCTVTFIARRNGYALGMNRDEQRTRSTARPPALHGLRQGSAIYPTEQSGGTWIGVNDRGITHALLNWYSVKARVNASPISRGTVVPALLPSGTSTEVEHRLSSLPLSRLKPFRLVSVFPAERVLMEWRWNQSELEGVPHPWRIRGWFSSGFDEAGAQVRRAEQMRAALSTSPVTLHWLRKLHRSHSPCAGPYSYCMHREDAVTVSYTEVVATGQTVTMRYHDGSPCLSRSPVIVTGSIREAFGKCAAVA